MASLTESSLIFNMMNPEEPKKNNNWYDRVYLCLEDTDFKSPTTFGQIKGFKCYRYNSFENADEAWYKEFGRYHKMNIRHIIIPICKWTPRILDKYILDWKLKNIYWLGKHYVGYGYKGYSHKK